MDFTEKDYLEEARSRITYQFKSSNNLDNLLNIWLQGYQDLQKTLLDIRLINDVETASGVQLDNIGEIVGQPRELINVTSTGYFGFEEDTSAKTFGSTDNSSGGLYYSLGDPVTGNILLADPLYRLFVKAKIRNNSSGGTPEEVIAATKDLFQTNHVELLEGNPDDETEGAVFSLYIGRPWNDPEQTVFPGLDEADIASRILPRPVGVRIIFTDVGVTETLNSVDNWSFASDELYTLANVTYPSTLSA